jgi:hypothetical protein
LVSSRPEEESVLGPEAKSFTGIALAAAIKANQKTLASEKAPTTFMMDTMGEYCEYG